MRELVRRTSRALSRMRLRNLAESQATAGSTAIASSASCQLMASITPTMPTIMAMPQTQSRNAQAMMSVSRLQSDVSRAISQPVGR